MTMSKGNLVRRAIIVQLVTAMVLGNIVLISGQAAAPATEQLIEKNEMDGGGGLSVFANNDLAQCFYASGDYVLTKVSLYIMDQAPIDNDLTVQIHDNDDFGTPMDPFDDIPGAPIGSGVSLNTPDNIFLWADFDFSSIPVPLIKDERYWIVASSGGADGEGYLWGESGADEYPGGYMAEGGNPVWILDPSNDLLFRVHGEFDNDVGVEKVIAPRQHELHCEANVTAVVKNFGAVDQGSFDVHVVIIDPHGGVALDKIRTVIVLDSGDTINLSWFFTPVLEGVYTISITTLMSGDEYDANNASSRDMNVEAQAVLKLHDEITVNGLPNDWDASGFIPENTWYTSLREYIWRDEQGDDNGDGDYDYPLHPRFEPNCLDLEQFRVAVDSNSINFLLQFGSIDDGSGDGSDGPLGFSEQIIEILIDIDGDGTGRDDTVRNARLRMDRNIGWEYAIWVDGWGNGYVEDENGNIYNVISAAGSPLSDIVEISLPAVAGNVIPDFKSWSYVVMVGAQDGGSLPDPIQGSRSGFMKVDSIASFGSGGGGVDLNGADSNVYDLAFASPQVPQLNNYGDADILLASHTDISGVSGADIDISEVWAQSFVAPKTSLLSSVSIYARDAGPDSPFMGITIRPNEENLLMDPSDDEPGDINLSSTEITDFSGSYQWQSVEFSNPPVILAGETYWIVAVSIEDPGQGYQWAKNPGDPWPGGVSAQYLGGIWSQQSDDMLFEASYRDLATVSAHQNVFFAPLVINTVYANGSADSEQVGIHFNGTVNAPDLNMYKWSLSDQDGNTFVFKNFNLSNKNSVTVHSGAGTNSTTDLFWGQTSGIWDNYGDDVLLNSSLLILVDYMNYTDGIVFGDPPPNGMNWGSDGFDEIPKNPDSLQYLALKVSGTDNDLYSDWGLAALGNIEIKTLYFVDDGTLDEDDPWDFMNTIPPVDKNPLDVDNDGKPGLTLRRSGPTTDPKKYQEFNVTPVLAGDLNMADDMVIDLWVDEAKGGSQETVIITLYDCNATKKTEIANSSITFVTADSVGWELVTMTIPDLDYTIPAGHFLMLLIRADSSSDEDLWLAYNASNQPSGIRTLPTRTYVNVDWAKTFDISRIEMSDFMLGEKVLILANVSDPFGSYDISGTNVTILPPGGPAVATEKAMDLENTDPGDPSAWKLFNYTYTNTDEPGTYKVTIKGIESNSVVHSLIIYFNVLNNSAPSLSNASLVPLAGLAQTYFNFTVNYTDSDNDPPGSITVNITGLGIFDLKAFNPGDMEYKDGKLYFINVTGFVNGTTYTHHFAANDSKGLWTKTLEFPGPEIWNSAPILSDGAVIPSTGWAQTAFNFTVNYTDFDNQPPATITVNITGPSHAGSWVMAEVNFSDTDFTDGKLYYYDYTGFINGSYSHHFAASDSQGAWAETVEFLKPDVLNTPPAFRNPMVAPVIGYITTEFNYTVTYMDLDDHAPANITVNITGPSHSGSWVMIEVDPSDTTYTDGKDYYYSYTGLTVGAYSFHFAANDSKGAWNETSGILWPWVLNTRPVLSDHGLDPTVGDAGSTVFNYTVTYTDLDNHAPGNITVNITGPFSGNFTMLELEPSDTNLRDGKVYYFTTTLPLDGNYTYRFDANDTLGLWAIPVLDSGPNVGSETPVLSQPWVNPLIGITTTWYNFTVNFTDLQNDSAGVILLNLSGPASFTVAMLELDTGDIITTDGKYFYINLTGLEKGIYSFKMEGNDSAGNPSESTVRYFPWVLNSLPRLSGGFTNQSNYGGSWFNFTVIYTDIDNDTAGSVNVNITGLGNVTMTELNTMDMIWSDGKAFYCNLTIPKGSYTYRFEAIDSGFGEKWNYTGSDGFDLINNIPVFLLQDVTPPSGFGMDFFNFTAVVSDYDNDTLSLTLYITGEPGSPYAMLELDSTDIIYLDGKSFFYNMSIAKGDYTFYFSVFDGEVNLDTVSSWLNISNNPPIILTLDVGDTPEDAPYSVDYDHIDLDGDGVTWVLETNATWLNLNPGTCLLTGTPTNLEVGSYYVNVSVDDGDGGLDFHNFTLNVTNTIPLLTTIPDIFAQEDALHLDDFDCVDDGQGSIGYSLITNASWLNIDSGNGLLSGTPDNTQVGWFWVNVSVTDGNGGMHSINYSLAVNNTPPSLTTTPLSDTLEDALHLDDFNCNDDNQGDIAYVLVSNATWLNLNPITGILSGTPNNAQVGWYWINVTVTDGNGGSDSINYTLTVHNTPPCITNVPDVTATEDSPHSDDFDCDDDGQGNISYSIYTNASWLAINGSSGVLSGTPDNTQVGGFWVNVTVLDGNGGSDSENYSLSIQNIPPSITTVPDATSVQDTLHTDDFDCDDDGQGNISYSLLTNATWLGVNASTGVLSGTPDSSDIGSYWVNVTVSDGNGGMDSVNYTLDVVDVNDPPSIITSNIEFAVEDSPYSVDYNHTDMDNDPVTWILDSDASWLGIDSLTGILSGTPENNDVGSYYVNVSVDDGRGGVAFTNFTLTVNNTPPSITSTPLEFIDEDKPILDDFDCTDEGSGSITYVLSTNATWLDINITTGVLSGTFNNTQIGWYWVNMTVTDGNGGWDFRDYTLTVNNTPPFITTVPDRFTDEDDVYFEDFNSEDDGQGNITYHLATNASWMSIDSQTGVVSGTPVNDDVGDYWVNVSVTDGNGGIHWRNYSLTVVNTNDPPRIITLYTEYIDEDSNYLVDYEYTDVDVDSVEWSVDTNASWLSMDPDTGVLSGTPDNDDVGWYRINVTVDDGQGGFDFTNYILIVNNTNDAPTVPQLIFPADDSSVNTTYPEFSWSASLDLDMGDAVANYTLQYSNASDFIYLLFTVTGITTTFYTPDIPLEYYTTYYWRVAAIDMNGESSGFQSTHFVFRVDTGYLPSFYIGGIKSASVRVGDTWEIDLDDYFWAGSDADNVTFTCNYEGVHIDPMTHFATWAPQHDNAVLTDVIFSVTNGRDSASSSPVDLSVEKEPGPMSIWERILWPWTLIPITILGLLTAALMLKRYMEKPIVEEVFFLHENGNLIHYASIRPGEEVDQDILGGMLTGVKDLISEAFVRDKEAPEGKGLHKLEFGERNIFLEKGHNFFIALVYSGREDKALLVKVKGVAREIETRYADALEDWDGELKVFSGVDEIIATLLPLDQLPGYESDGTEHKITEKESDSEVDIKQGESGPEREPDVGEGPENGE